MSFLAKIIKEAIKEELVKELQTLKQDLEMKIQSASRNLNIPANTFPQHQMTPLMFSQVPSIVNPQKTLVHQTL